MSVNHGGTHAFAYKEGRPMNRGRGRVIKARGGGGGGWKGGGGGGGGGGGAEAMEDTMHYVYIQTQFYLSL